MRAKTKFDLSRLQCLGCLGMHWPLPHLLIAKYWYIQVHIFIDSSVVHLRFCPGVIWTRGWCLSAQSFGLLWPFAFLCDNVDIQTLA